MFDWAAQYMAIHVILQQTHNKLTQTLQHMYVCVNLPCANLRFENQVIWLAKATQSGVGLNLAEKCIPSTRTIYIWQLKATDLHCRGCVWINKHAIIWLFSFTSLLTGGTFRPDPARPHFGSLKHWNRSYHEHRTFSGTPGLVVNTNVNQFQLPTLCLSFKEYHTMSA